MGKPQKKDSGPRPPMVPVTDDPRFARIHTDPRFALPKRKDNKVVIDKRFAGALKDEDFVKKAKVDRYGRAIEREEGKEELKRYYRLEDEDIEKSTTESESEEEEEAEEGPKYDPARGGGFSSSSEDESDSEVDEDEEARAREELEEADSVPMGEETRRFAAVNMDWDNVRAVDLMAAFDSFKPSGGKVLRVTVYPSEFGKERMQREELEGPPREIFKDNDYDSDEEVTTKTILKEDKGEDFDSSKLRKYQLERLRYYYAVVECDSAKTARHIYDNCDGAEYEASANFFDLRFIPDDVTFDEEPREVCDSPDANYKPKEFVTDALQNSKVKLTWDADDQQRLQVAKKAFSQKEIEENDIKAYLASSDDESDEEAKEEAKRRYRTLLGLGDESAAGKEDGPKEGEMEITFTTEDKNKKEAPKPEDEETTLEKYQRKEREKKKARKEKMLAKRGEGEKAESEEEKEDLGFDDPFFEDPTPAAKRKSDRKAEKAKKKAEKAAQAEEKEQQKAELELLMMDDEDNVANGKSLDHFDLKQVIKAEKAKKGGKKKKKQKQLDGAEGIQGDFTMDVDDPRFSAVFNKHEFAIDPTNPRFFKTEGMKKLMEEKRKRRRDDDDGEKNTEKTVKKNKKDNKKDNGVSTLVERIKKKAGK